MLYNREKAVAYAHKQAAGRNRAYYDFDELDGNCTSFISQCLFAGCGIMNFTCDTGWYFKSIKNMAAA